MTPNTGYSKAALPPDFEDGPTLALDPVRAHALLCAATYLALAPLPSEAIDIARTFEAYLRGEPT